MLVEAVNRNFDKLNASDLQSLSMIMDHAGEVANLRIEEVALMCSTSKSTILRLAQKLGFSGYSEFKNCLKWEAKEQAMQGDEEGWQNIKRDFLNTCQQLETSPDLKTIASLIQSSRNVVVYGTGQAQRYCAMELQRMFMEVNKYIYYVGASDEFRMLAKDLGPQDMVIILSLSGSIDKMKDSLQLLKLKGVKRVSITKFQSNDLARMCNYHLYATTTPITLAENLEHHSFMNYFTVIEYLFLAYYHLER